MKNIFLLLSCLIAGSTFCTPNIHEALKNPSAITILQLNGTANESSLLIKNAARFTALQKIIISGISDSIMAEQDFVAVAACSNVSKLVIDNCGFSHLSGAIKMLVSIEEVEISKCDKLEINSAFSALVGMPSLNSISYSTNQLLRMPQSFTRMRGMKKISIHNTDLSLADGYALNNSSPESLFTNEKLVLGFGENSLVLEYGCYDKTSAREHISIMRDMLQGAAGMNGEMKLPQRAKAFTRENPLVKPPIAGLDVRKNIYSTDATTGGLVEYPSGTRVFIPDHAFVDAKGNPVEGNVTIDYREFRDQVDILLSGIPMTYDSAGVKGNFESAGMFEINASVDGKEVFLASGKKVDLEFAVVDTTSNYNFYRLDEKLGWIYEEHLGKTDNPNMEEQTDDDFLPAFAFHRRTLMDLRRMPKLMDTTSIDSRYADLTYFYTQKNKHYATTAARQFYSSSYWSIHKVISKKAYCCFKIHKRFRNGNNPEMSAFSNVIWKTTDNVRSKEMRRLFRRKNGVNDLRVYFDGENFQLEFKTFEGYKTISATPVHIINKKMVEFTPAMLKARYRLYSRMLEQRKRHLVREIRNNKNYISHWRRKLSADSVRYWKNLRPRMSEHQKNMSYAEWIAFEKTQKFNSSLTNPAYSLSVAGQQYNRKAYQRLSTFRFGIFNCDHTIPLPEPIEVFAVCNPDGEKTKKPETQTIYLLDQNRNMTITYDAMDQASPVPIAFGKNHQYALVAVSWDGLVSIGDAVAFRNRKQIDSSTCSFETTSVSDQPLTAQELRLLIMKSK